MLVAATAATSAPVRPRRPVRPARTRRSRASPPSTSKSWPPGTPGGSWCVHSRARRDLFPGRGEQHRPAAAGARVDRQQVGAGHVSALPASRTCGFTTCSGTCPASRLATAATARCAPRASVSAVAPPMCGVDEDVGRVQQRVPRPGGRPLQHVKGRPAEPALFQRRAQRRLVHQRLARGVDEVRAGPHPRELGAGEHVPVLGGGARVQRHDVRAFQQRVQRHHFDAAPPEPAAAGRNRCTVKPSARGPRRHLAADPAETDQAQGQAGRLAAEELPALRTPTPRSRRRRAGAGSPAAPPGSAAARTRW